MDERSGAPASGRGSERPRATSSVPKLPAKLPNFRKRKPEDVATKVDRDRDASDVNKLSNDSNTTQGRERAPEKSPVSYSKRQRTSEKSPASYSKRRQVSEKSPESYSKRQRVSERSPVSFSKRPDFPNNLKEPQDHSKNTQWRERPAEKSPVSFQKTHRALEKSPVSYTKTQRASQKSPVSFSKRPDFVNNLKKLENLEFSETPKPEPKVAIPQVKRSQTAQTKKLQPTRQPQKSPVSFSKQLGSLKVSETPKPGPKDAAPRVKRSQPNRAASTKPKSDVAPEVKVADEEEEIPASLNPKVVPRNVSIPPEIPSEFGTRTRKISANLPAIEKTEDSKIVLTKKPKATTMNRSSTPDAAPEDIPQITVDRAKTVAEVENVVGLVIARGQQAEKMVETRRGKKRASKTKTNTEIDAGIDNGSAKQESARSRKAAEAIVKQNAQTMEEAEAKVGKGYKQSVRDLLAANTSMQTKLVDMNDEAIRAEVTIKRLQQQILDLKAKAVPDPATTIGGVPYKGLFGDGAGPWNAGINLPDKPYRRVTIGKKKWEVFRALRIFDLEVQDEEEHEEVEFDGATLTKYTDNDGNGIMFENKADEIVVIDGKKWFVKNIMIEQKKIESQKDGQSESDANRRRGV